MLRSTRLIEELKSLIIVTTNHNQPHNEFKMAAPLEEADVLAIRNIASRMDVDPPSNSEEIFRGGEATEKVMIK